MVNSFFLFFFFIFLNRFGAVEMKEILTAVMIKVMRPTSSLSAHKAPLVSLLSDGPEYPGHLAAQSAKYGTIHKMKKGRQ